MYKLCPQIDICHNTSKWKVLDESKYLNQKCLNFELMEINHFMYSKNITFIKEPIELYRIQI